MKPRRSIQHRRAGAFTLIEVLLALALLAALLLAVNQFIFAITEAWTKSQDRYVFSRHAQAVAQHVESLLAAAANRARASGSATGAPALAALALPNGAGTVPVLAFDLPQPDRVMAGPGATLPEIWCALAWTRETGLALYWKSRLEVEFATVDPRRAILSSFVKSVSYDYLDATSGTWSEKAEPESGPNNSYLRPQRLRLHFERAGQQIVEVVEMPPETEEGVAVP